jgi:formamidopyrimidine-DNA glycosylase
MPELPEVETIRRQLARKIIGKRLDGRKVIGVRRRAKILIIDFADNSSLIFHLKLTGQLIFNGKPSQYTRKVFNFHDGSQLIFNDVRKLGWWKKVKGTRKIEEKFGPEALEVNLEALKVLVQKRQNSKIKPLLMDQKFIAGIGNIYSDEILFTAKINPLRKAKTLSDEEIRKIHQNIKKILKEAIKHRGTTVRDYLDICGRRGDYTGYLKVYGKEGEKCSRCGAVIKRVKIGGRSAHFCPNCQRL